MFHTLIFSSIILMLFISSSGSAEGRSCSVNGAIGWYPIIFREDKQVKGLAVDALKSFENNHDVILDFGNETPWIRIEDQLANGTLDIVAGAFYTKKRETFGKYSQAFFTEEVSIFVAKERPFRFIELRHLIGRTGMRPGSGSYGEIFDKFARENLEIQSIIGTETMFRMLIANRADYVVLAKLDGQTWLKKLELQEQVVTMPVPAAINNVYFLFGKKGKCTDIIDDLNAHITSLQKSPAWQEMLSQY